MQNGTRITVYDHANGNKVCVDLDPSVSMGNVIESVAAYFEKDFRPFALRRRTDGAFFSYSQGVEKWPAMNFLANDDELDLIDDNSG